MNIIVERCFLGNSNYAFRFSRRFYGTFMMPTENEGQWTRADAIEAKRIIELEWNIAKRNIRFIHVN